MSTLSINLVPGYLPADGELIDNSILRQIARPTVQLDGTIGAASIADGGVTTAKLADGVLTADATGRAKMVDGFVTAAKINATQDWTGKTLSGTPTVTWTGAVDFSGATFTPPNGMLVQQVHSSDAVLRTVTAAIPIDDTVPQNTEGTELTSLATTITPKDATNILEIEVIVPIGISAAGTIQAAALFQDTTANALAAVAMTNGTNDSQNQLVLRYRMAAGTTSATTFKVRVGTSGGSIYVNGLIGGTRVFGGVSAARLFIKEITA